jgi:hypothetical protein
LRSSQQGLGGDLCDREHKPELFAVSVLVLRRELEERVDESLHKKHTASKIYHKDAKHAKPEPKRSNFSDGSIVGQCRCEG